MPSRTPRADVTEHRPVLVRYSLRRRVAAWGVHLFTASGAAVGLLALDAIRTGRYGHAFAWMAVAFAVDSADGTLARAAEVKRVLPGFDGSRLDDLIDYLNYTVVPVALIYAAGRLPAGVVGTVVAGLVLMASAYGFCQTDAKTDDGYFKGFPSYWNVVVFYLMVLDLSPWACATVLAVFSVLVFVPLYYLYPSKAPRWRVATIVSGLMWAVSCLVILARFADPPSWLVWGSLLFPAYYLGSSLYLTPRR